jgi:DNA polymerase I
MTIALLPEFQQALENLPKPKPWTLPIRPDLVRLAAGVQFVETLDQAEALMSELNRLPLGAIAIDTEFRFTSPPVALVRKRSWQDPTTLEPLLLSGAAWVPQTDAVVRFVFDIRRRELVPVISRLLRLHTIFIGHFFNAEFKTLWALGIEPAFSQIYDTWVAARALTLGRGHRSIDLLAGAREAEDTAAEAEANEMLVGHLSLVGQCSLYGIEHRYATAKECVQRAFLRHQSGTPFTSLQIDYSAADAEATLRLYLAQQKEVIAAGLQPHLMQVEFPYAEANARMEWDGVPVSRERLARLREGLVRAVDLHRWSLADAGLCNPNSVVQAVRFLQQRGHGDRLVRNGKPTTSDEVLAQIEQSDPMVTHLRRYRTYARLLADPLFDRSLIGSDGRLHPDHRQLGAGTGRNSCSTPNIVGVSKTFRPIVAAPAGRAIVELDYAQIEVGICAAEHHDEALITAFNSGDVYAAVAQQFYVNDLTAEERNLTPAEFKKRRADLRDRIKTFVLAVLYNMQAQAVADRFGVSIAEAERQRQAFLDCYPSVRAAMVAAAEDGKVRGFASIVGGLRRYIPAGRKAVNQLINTPVQASAAVVFREAIVCLYQHFRGTAVKVILPVHDAVVIECNRYDVDAVASEARRIMIDAVRKYYPSLCPRVDVNATDPTCWNKDGHSDTLDHFLADPMYKFGEMWRVGAEGREDNHKEDTCHAS